MIKSNRAYVVIPLIFLLVLVILIITVSSNTHFFSINFRQPSANHLFPIHKNNLVSQSIELLDVDAILFSPKTRNLIAAVNDPLFVEIVFHNTGSILHHKCSILQIFFSQKCEICDLSRLGGENNIVTFTFYSKASEGVYGIWGTQNEAPIDGGLSIAGEAVNGGLEFYGYHLGPQAIQLFPVFQNFLTLICMTVFSFLAGIGLTLLLQENKHTRSELVIISIFFGVAISVLFVLVFSLIKLPFKFLPYLFGMLLFINITLAIISAKKHSNKHNFTAIQPNEIWLIILLLFATLVCSIQVTKVVSPLWIDGLFHHDLIQKIIMSNNVFTGNVYPIGFHALAIAQNFLFRHQIMRSILLTGQWLVILSGLSFFMFAGKLSTMKMSSWIGTLFYLFLSPFPNYLINWSRYPYLFGLVLLPVALFFFMLFLEDYKYIWVVIAWVFLISITHYSTFLLMIAGAITCVIVYSRREAFSFKSLSNHKRISVLLFILILGSGYLLYRFLILIQMDKLSILLDQTRLISENTDYIYSFGLTLQNYGLLIYLVAIVGCFVSVKKNKKTLIFLFLWLLIAILMICMQKFFLEASILTIVNLFYFLAIPLCLLAGVSIAYAYEKIDNQLRYKDVKTGKSSIDNLSEKLLLLILLFCCFFAGYQKSALVNPKVVTVTPEDIKAYQWIEANTSGNAKFLINSYEWGYEYKPVDGGGWINAFTQRPVFLFSGNVDSTSMKEFIDEKKIEYVYLGHGLRAISSDWLHDDCLVFQEDNIKIYGVNQQDCYQN